MLQGLGPLELQAPCSLSPACLLEGRLSHQSCHLGIECLLVCLTKTAPGLCPSLCLELPLDQILCLHFLVC